SFFAPLYFVSIGLKVDFVMNFDPLLTLILIVLASIGKIVGAGTGAYLTGSKIRESLAIGMTMNARGAMEIILASVALEYHLIDQRVFVALVIMAFITSLLSIPGLKWLVPPPGK
ncbi:cation:proton antiporter, partial [candidate division KSB1 bacterium]|nr:cation:proton antiporter [candidate division KSB1 bacterium]